MSDYIKREDAIKIINSGISTDTDADRRYVNGLFRAIRPADVAPVRHGHWDFYDGKWYCSACGYCMEWCLNKPIEDWCGSCGARMDGGNNEID